MSSELYGSLQFRLAVRVALLYVVATGLAVAVLLYEAYDNLQSLNDRELSLRASDLARAIALDKRGKPSLYLSPQLSAAYGAASQSDVFSIRAADGSTIAASHAEFALRAAGWPKPSDDPSYFKLEDIGLAAHDYYGLSIELDSAAGPVSIAVARASGADALVHALLHEFLVDVAWSIPLLVLVTLAIGVLAIRSGLKPVRAVSALAATIGPNATSVRIPLEGLPSEIKPLVAAVNQALDRLERGFEIQRRFTSDAAHELRNPLAIITAALDGLGTSAEAARLRGDIARMNRLVDQLLRVARLDSVALDVTQPVDLCALARETVAGSAPWALAQGKALAYSTTGSSEIIPGNADGIGAALRNLIENAVAHTAPGTEVSVNVSSTTLFVSDRGPGVAATDRQRVFDRFWRGPAAPGQGAGLGLAIVREIMRAHRGTVTVTDHHGGGATFAMNFPTPRTAVASGGPESDR